MIEELGWWFGETEAHLLTKKSSSLCLPIFLHVAKCQGCSSHLHLEPWARPEGGAQLQIWWAEQNRSEIEIHI